MGESEVEWAELEFDATKLGLFSEINKRLIKKSPSPAINGGRGGNTW